MRREKQIIYTMHLLQSKTDDELEYLAQQNPKWRKVYKIWHELCLAINEIIEENGDLYLNGTIPSHLKKENENENWREIKYS